MLRWIRGLLFSNWRNKGVALFFAATIWFVAYQSELGTTDRQIGVKLVPRQLESVIVRVEEGQAERDRKRFSGLVRLKISGSRKQIETARPMLEPAIVVEVDAPVGASGEPTPYEFDVKDMKLPRRFPVEILNFEPKAVSITFDERVEGDFEVDAAPANREGWETSSTVDPEVVRVSGPKSILDEIFLVASPRTTITSAGFNGRVPIQIRHEDLEPAELREMVTFLDASSVDLSITMKPRTSELPTRVKLKFLVPPLGHAYKIQIEDDADGTIPVRFVGPEREIHRLQERIEEDPNFFVAVEVPEFDPSRERPFTFTEEKLLLPGFSDAIEKRPHESRAAKGPWQCTIIPVMETTE